MKSSFVCMGVAGCGKSSLATACARQLSMTLLEGDDFHSPASLLKMQSGMPLSDADRSAWLAALAHRLAMAGGGLVLACSALRRSYRDQLRAASPGLRFVFLEISADQSRARVAARQGHVFSAALVDSQFATLESPVGEPGVLALDATRPIKALSSDVCLWLSEAEERARPGNTAQRQRR